jgi:NitT/TauT family transport system substrate-binding protein
VAGSAGCFAGQGIQVRLDETAGATKSAEALLGGSADVAASDYLVLLNLVNKGQPVREFVLMQSVPGLVGIVSPKASQPIRRIEDLKGRTVGVNAMGNAYHRLFNHILSLHGLKPDEVNVVPLGAGGSLAAAVERGVVDLVLGGPMTVSNLQRRYPSLTMLFDTRKATSTKAVLGTDEVASFILCARTSWLAAQPETARHMAAAMQCALTWVHGHTPAQIRAALPESSRSTDVQADLDWITAAKSGLSMDGRMTPAAHAGAVRFLTGPDAAKFENQVPYTNEFLKP